MYRPFSEASAVEFTAEARLGTAGGSMLSDRALLRTKLGIAGIEPGAGLGLRCGPMLELVGGIPAVAISCLKSATTMSSAARANWSDLALLKLICATWRSD